MSDDWILAALSDVLRVNLDRLFVYREYDFRKPIVSNIMNERLIIYDIALMPDIFNDDDFTPVSIAN